MRLDSGSFAVVLVGDWNRLYSKPEWIAQNIYEENEIEISIGGAGLSTDFKVMYRKGNVIIAPEQQMVTFGATDMTDETIENMVRYVNNYLSKAVSPELSAYGFNLDFSDANATLFAEVVDNMSDSMALIENGYSIEATRVEKSLVKDGKNINIKMSFDNKELNMHFNEHHDREEGFPPTVSKESLESFIAQCKSIVLALGYEIEGEEDE